MQIETVRDFRRAIRNGAYAWPGGYPLYFVTADGAAISYAGARVHRRSILEAIATRDARSGWCITAADVNWEDDELYCDATGVKIESAYTE